jgi:hypothetical protein
MRRLVLCLVLFLVTISAATGVHASTECEKWLTEYKNSLAHSPAAHRVKAAHHRLHHYIHRRLAILKPKPKTAPKPHLLPVRRTRPKMTREELLKRLELACGDLPLDQPEVAKLNGDPAPEFVPEMPDDGDPIELASNDGGGFLQTLPPPVYPGSSSAGTPGFPGFPSAPPIGGGGGRTPSSPTVPGSGCEAQAKVVCQPVPPDQPPVAEAPEPGTFVLLFTGLSGMAEIIRRRAA